MTDYEELLKKEKEEVNWIVSTVFIVLFTLLSVYCLFALITLIVLALG